MQSPLYLGILKRVIYRLAIVVLSATYAYGCVCASLMSPKGEWQASALVFVGVVEQVTAAQAGPPRAQHVIFRVEEPFKGCQKGQLIQIDQTGSNCEMKYRQGWRGLLYLSTRKNELWLSPGCSRSTAAQLASDDLSFLRGLPASAVRTRISGQVVLAGNAPRPLFNVTVTITRESGSPTTAHTDKNGVFEVYDVPQGSYSIAIRVPKRLELDFGFVSGPITFSYRLPLRVDLDKSHATAVFFLKRRSGAE